MVKKLFFFLAVLFIAGCSNTQNQLKDMENAVFSLDKTNSGRVCALYPDKQNIKTFGTLINGKLQGRYTEYYKNGSPLLITYYKDGKQNGTARKFYENGNIQIKGFMKDDLAEGKFTFFYEEGGRSSIKNLLKNILVMRLKWLANLNCKFINTK